MIGDDDHLKVFASEEAAERRFTENDHVAAVALYVAQYNLCRTPLLTTARDENAICRRTRAIRGIEYVQQPEDDLSGG